MQGSEWEWRLLWDRGTCLGFIHTLVAFFSSSYLSQIIGYPIVRPLGAESQFFQQIEQLAALQCPLSLLWIFQMRHIFPLLLNEQAWLHTFLWIDNSYKIALQCTQYTLVKHYVNIWILCFSAPKPFISIFLAKNA